MRRSPIILLSLLGSMIVSPAALAQRPIESGGDIIPACRTFLEIMSGPTTVDELGLIRSGICAGKVSALLNVGPMLEPIYRFCKPAEVTVRQAVEVALKRLDERPEAWNELFDTLALEAFVTTWPCR